MTDSTILVAKVRERFYHIESKRYLAEKHKNRLTLFSGGGQFTATVDLIAFLREPTNDTPNEILIDNYGNPVKVVRQELLTSAIEVYNTVMSEWHDEYTELSKER
jgi:hypothetical protein